MTCSTKWDKRYLELAKLVSTWSKDPSKQVGAVVSKDGYIAGLGFNGFPRPIDDTHYRLTNKELKNKLMVHAEVNALISAGSTGDVVYVWPCLPCMPCFMHILQCGIKRIVTSKTTKERQTSWDKDLVLQIAGEHNVAIIYI